jgi:predicted transcriptional regulator of viral defense system
MGSEKRTLPRGRLQLAQVLRASGDLVRVYDAEAVLKISRVEAAKRLSRWTAQGWLHRVGSGLYVPVAIDMLGAKQVIDDPWILVPTLFAPCYVGGRTAAEHWDLTEQLFKDIVVVTGQSLRRTRQLRHGTQFTLKHVSRADNLFGTKTVWRLHSRVLVSDVHRTIIDMLDDPSLGGGIQHVADCFYAYLTRTDRDDDSLLTYAERLGNGAIFKRLGFLSERMENSGSLTDACIARLTTGVARLDPALECPVSMPRWRLQIPQTWASHI